MPKMRVNADAEAFAARLVALLMRNGQPRRGGGAYLAKKYKVASVTANAWLNGEYKPGIPIAEKIATDHGSSLDELYFGKEKKKSKPSLNWPFSISRERYDNLSPGGKLKVEAALIGTIIDLEGGYDAGMKRSSR